MTGLLNVISSAEKQEILTRFAALRDTCCPDQSVGMPSFTFKKKKDFIPVLDDFHCGLCGCGYNIKPEEIKGYSWQDRKTLNDSYIDFIMAGKTKWYYNTSEKTGNFFSEDGQKKVEVDFNFWMDATDLWSVPGLRHAVHSVLKKCAGDSFPTEEEAQKDFNDELCAKIYGRSPSVKSIKQKVLEIIEPLRRSLLAALVKSKSAEIVKSRAFKKYAVANKIDTSKPEKNLAQSYLQKNKNAIYLLGEKFGLIKKANSLIRYQKMRDSVRHPNEVESLLKNPQRLYQDFFEALNAPTLTPKGNALLEQDMEVFDNLGYMSEILDILSIYENKKLKKKDPAYWQDLVQKGILENDEVAFLQKMVLECNTVGHVNANSDASKKIVADENLIQICANLEERHEKQQHQLKVQRRRWIKETSLTF